MKTIIAILLMVAGVAQAQRSEYLDSLTSARTSVSINVSGYEYVSVYFRGLATADTLTVYNQLDSAMNDRRQGILKYPTDSMSVALKNIKTTLTDTTGTIIGKASPIEFLVLNSNLDKLKIAWRDVTLGHVIYMRIRYTGKYNP